MGTRRAVKSAANKSVQRRTRATSRASKRRTKTAAKRANTRPRAHVGSKKPAANAAPSGDKVVFRDDPALDRRIIEGMLSDRPTLMAEMAKIGYNSAAVLRRAAELGLSEALIRQVRGVAADLAGERPGRKAAPTHLGARTCLSCDRIFLSTGPGNRLCMRCRGGDAGLAQL